MPFESALILAVVVATIALLPIWNYRHVRNGEWHLHGRNMRRMGPDGRWQVREATELERLD